MTDWKNYYKQHLTTEKDVIKHIEPGDVIWLGQGPQIPYTMLEELHTNMEDYHDVWLYWNVMSSPSSLVFDPDAKRHFRMCSVFNNLLERSLVDMDTIENHACGYDHIVEGFYENGGNAIAIHILPPDENGVCNVGHYGVSNTTLFMNDSRLVKKIAFVDKTGMYPVKGDPKDVNVNITDFDYIIECDTDMVEIPSAGPTPVDKKIANFIIPELNKGDKIQIGFGGLGEEILANLDKGGPYEVFTEVCCDSMADQLAAGNLTKIVATSPGACSHKFFDMLAVDDRIQLIPLDRMINLDYIDKQENFVAINATFMVDLLGQACSEAQGLKPYSGAGGSLAYIYGAMRAPGGRSFLTLRSTYKDHDGNRHSNIVPWLPEGCIVTTPKNIQMYIVSEWGVADIYLKTTTDRIRALIKIAHPDYREELKEKILTTPLISEFYFEGVDLYDNVEPDDMPENLKK